MSRRLVKKLKNIANDYQSKFRICHNLTRVGGYYICDKSNFVISSAFSQAFMISSFFHELCHLLDHRENKFTRYYDRTLPNAIRSQIALRAELHTDIRAEKLCKKYFPKIKYKRSYRNKADRQFLAAYYRRQK